MREINSHQISLRDSAERNAKDLKLIYQELRNIIDEREQLAIAEIHSKLDREQIKYNEDLNKAKHRIELINDFENNTFGAIVGSEDEI